VSFIGHGIGLELIEHPIMTYKSKVSLQPGMIFAIEPKLVYLDEFAAGIESIFLVTETGHRLISQTPVQIFIC
jgi:Xaa-Pro dipeptidase